VAVLFNVSPSFMHERARFLISTVLNLLLSFPTAMELTIIKMNMTRHFNPSMCHVSNIYGHWDGGTNSALLVVHKNIPIFKSIKHLNIRR